MRYLTSPTTATAASTFEITRFNKQVINFARALHVHYTIDLRACLHGVGDSGLVGLVSFVFTHWGDTKQKKPTLLDQGPPLHVNRVLITIPAIFTRAKGLMG